MDVVSFMPCFPVSQFLVTVNKIMPPFIFRLLVQKLIVMASTERKELNYIKWELKLGAGIPKTGLSDKKD